MVRAGPAASGDFFVPFDIEKSRGPARRKNSLRRQVSFPPNKKKNRALETPYRGNA